MQKKHKKVMQQVYYTSFSIQFPYMQTYNSFDELVAGNCDGADISVFNDRTRMNQMHARIKATKAADVRNAPELAKLVTDENQYWKQVNKANLTVEQQQEYNDWKMTGSRCTTISVKHPASARLLTMRYNRRMCQFFGTFRF
jgi:hypothetical protein